MKLLALFILLHLTIAKELYDISFYKVACIDVNKKYVYNFTCYTKSLDRKTKASYMILILHPDVVIDKMKISMQSFHKFNTIYRSMLIKTKEDFCGMVKGRTKAPFFGMFWDSIKKVSNLQCPLTQAFNISGMILDDTNLPPTIPEGYGRIDFIFLNGTNEEKMFNIQCYFRVIPKGAVELSLK